MIDKQEFPEEIWFYDHETYTLNKAIKYNNADGSISYICGPQDYKMHKKELYVYDYDGLIEKNFKWFLSLEECKEHRLIKLKEKLDRITQEINTEPRVYE